MQGYNNDMLFGMIFRLFFRQRCKYNLVAALQCLVVYDIVNPVTLSLSTDQTDTFQNTQVLRYSRLSDAKEICQSIDT